MRRLRRLRAAVRKDLLDALRTATVWIFLALPIIAGFMARMETRPVAHVAHPAGAETRLLEALRAETDGLIAVEFVGASDETEIRRMVRDKDADLGLVYDDDFDEAMAGGRDPRLEVVHREFRELRDLRAELVVAAVDPAVRRVAGQTAPAMITSEVVVLPGGAGRFVFRELGSRFLALALLVMFITFLILGLVPASLAEESERKTLDALLLAGTYGEVVLAKALYGLVFVVFGVPLVLGIAQIPPADPLLVAAGVGLLSVSLIGVGLLLGILARTQSQVSVWGQLVSLPLIAAAFATGFALPPWADALLSAVPTSQATRLIVNGVTGQRLFDGPWLSALVIAAWGVVAYTLLFWQLARREA